MPSQDKIRRHSAVSARYRTVYIATVLTGSVPGTFQSTKVTTYAARYHAMRVGWGPNAVPHPYPGYRVYRF